MGYRTRRNYSAKQKAKIWDAGNVVNRLMPLAAFIAVRPGAYAYPLVSLALLTCQAAVESKTYADQYSNNQNSLGTVRAAFEQDFDQRGGAAGCAQGLPGVAAPAF
jgi:hypothetical protein